MNQFIDHTCEVERRITAIRIASQDICIFFKPRDGTPVGLRQCRYCFYAVFDIKDGKPNQSGLCKFKK